MPGGKHNRNKKIVFYLRRRTEVMFITSVPLSVRQITQKLWTDFDALFWRNEAWPKNTWLNFGGDPDLYPNPNHDPI